MQNCKYFNRDETMLLLLFGDNNTAEVRRTNWADRDRINTHWIMSVRVQNQRERYTRPGPVSSGVGCACVRPSFMTGTVRCSYNFIPAETVLRPSVVKYNITWAPLLCRGGGDLGLDSMLRNTKKKKKDSWLEKKIYRRFHYLQYDWSRISYNIIKKKT